MPVNIAQPSAALKGETIPRSALPLEYTIRAGYGPILCLTAKSSCRIDLVRNT